MLRKKNKLNRFLVCPKCKKKLAFAEFGLRCVECKLYYKIKSDKIFFVNKRDKTDWLNKIKDRIKENPIFYFCLTIIFSPALSLGLKKWQQILAKIPNKDIVLNLGSGPYKIDERSQGVDIFPYKNVEIVADMQNLPIKSNSVGGVVSIATLEHLQEPKRAVVEMHRVLKRGGTAFCVVPFIYGFHSSPCDFFRWTEKGVSALFSGFKSCKIGVLNGPSSALISILPEFLAILFSFNIQILYKLLWFIFTLTVFPIKFLDLILNHFPFRNQALKN